MKLFWHGLGSCRLSHQKMLSPEITGKTPCFLFQINFGEMTGEHGGPDLQLKCDLKFCVLGSRF